MSGYIRLQPNSLPGAVFLNGLFFLVGGICVGVGGFVDYFIFGVEPFSQIYELTPVATEWIAFGISGFFAG